MSRGELIQEKTPEQLQLYKAYVQKCLIDDQAAIDGFHTIIHESLSSNTHDGGRQYAEGYLTESATRQIKSLEASIAMNTWVLEQIREQEEVSPDLL